MPSGITSIESVAFAACPFVSIVIPESVDYLGDAVFLSCSSLTSVTFENTEGWSCCKIASSGDKTALDVSDASANASSLTGKYTFYIWSCAVTGKPLTPYTTRYKPPEGWSANKAMKRAQVEAAAFEARCQAGEVMTKAESKAFELEQIRIVEQAKREESLKLTFSGYVEMEEKRTNPNFCVGFLLVFWFESKTKNNINILKYLKKSPYPGVNPR